MNLQKILWNELEYAKKNEYYITEYIAFIKAVKKWAEIIVLLLVTSGLAAWLSTQDTKWAVASSIVSVLAKIAELVVEKFVANDEYVQDLADLKKDWLRHFHVVEKIWLEWYIEGKEEVDILQYYLSEIVPNKASLEEKDSEIKIWRFFFLNNKSDKRTELAMNVYN